MVSSGLDDIDKESSYIQEQTDLIKSKSWYDFDPGEKVLWWGHPSMIIVLPEVIMGVLFFALGAVLSFHIGFAESSLMQYNALSNGITYIGYLTMFLAIAGVAYDYLKVKATYYIVSDEKLWYKKGIIKRDSRPVHYDRVQHARSYQDVLDRLIGIGSVNIATAGTSMEEKTFKHIRDPDHVNKVISDMMQEVRDDSGVEDREEGEE